MRDSRHKLTDRCKLTCLDKLIDKLRVVLDRIVPAELGILVPDGMKAVGTSGDNELRIDRIQDLNILG